MRKLVLAAVPLMLAAAVAHQEKITIQEWPVPFGGHPRDPYIAPNGNVWFVGQRGHYVAELDPKTGEFRKHDLEPGTGPHNLIVDNKGTIWYAGNLRAHVGIVDPKTGAITKIAMPDPAARDPHTLIFDKSGDIWFTVQGGNQVGKLDTETRQVQLVKVPTPNARPYGIKMDSKGVVWFNEFGSDKLGRIDPATMQLTEIRMPRPEARGRRIEITTDDRIWYVDYAQGYLGRYDPKANEFKEWALPSGPRSRPYGMAVDKHDRIWLVESGVQPNRFVGFDPKTEKFFSITEIPSGGGTVRHMAYDAPTNAVWFGTDAGTIGVARLQ